MRTYLLAAALLAALLSSGFSSVTSAAASPLQNLSDADIGEALAAHNAVRQRVAQAESQRLGSPVVIPDLTWNSDLATYAQEWADQLLSSDPDPDPDRRTFPHHDWGELQALGRGENIYAGWSDGGVPDQSPTAAVTWWDSEQQYYDYDTNTCAADQTCGHFTQLVWSTTTQVGCGQAVRTAAYGTQFVVWVCNYAPAGNIIGERPYDVMTVAQPDVEQQVVDLVNSERQRKFGIDKRDTLPRYCRACEVQHLCHGECPKHRFILTPDGEPGLNYLCPAYRRFFTHVDPAMRAMAELLRNGRPAADIRRRPGAAMS